MKYVSNLAHHYSLHIPKQDEEAKATIDALKEENDIPSRRGMIGLDGSKLCPSSYSVTSPSKVAS
jgi:hypothetical protein